MNLDLARTLFSAALARFEAGDAGGAEALLRRALAHAPERPSILANLCAALIAQGRLAEALPFAEQACRLDPDSLLAWQHAARCHGASGRVAEEAACLARALALGAEAGFRRRLVQLLLQLGREEEAGEALATLCDGERPAPEDQLALVEFLLRRQRPLKARAVALGATELNPALWQLWHALGQAELACNDTTAAVAAFERGLRLAGDAPGNLQLRWRRALALLRAGDYARGWSAFECRRERPQVRQLPWPASPEWHGREALAGRTLLLVSEQDPRDTLQFSRYAVPLAAAGACVLLWVEPELQTLLAGQPGVSAVHSKALPAPAHDFHVPLPSLPLACGTTLETMPPPAPPRVDAQRAAAWARDLTLLGRPRVGLVWTGPPPADGELMQVLSLRSLAPLFGMRADFVALQEAASDEDRALLPGLPILVPDRLPADLADMAALLSCFDLVIGVDALSAHLAASLGKPVWLLLPYAADWRWLRTRQDSPWYPSVRLFRQTRPGDWDEVIERVRRALGGREWDTPALR